MMKLFKKQRSIKGGVKERENKRAFVMDFTLKAPRPIVLRVERLTSAITQVAVTVGDDALAFFIPRALVAYPHRVRCCCFL